jgi:NAD(P)H-dependent flavin oxidoreductase YrpB (nitropropane dioxygenase family)
MGIGVSLSGLASAVANEGGIGVIASAMIGMLEPDFTADPGEANSRALRNEIRKARGLTSGIIGANIMVALTDYGSLVEVAFDEGADIVFLGAGIAKKPKGLPQDRLTSGTTKIAPIVSSARAVNVIFNYWKKNYNHVPDAVVVEGPKAGGHLGFKREHIDDPDYSLERILPDVVSAVEPYEQHFAKSIPVIAAGGVYTGADILRFLELGAKGVQMATRFVATHECDASIAFKEAYLECKPEDLIIIDSPVGLPGRAIKSRFLEEVSAGARKPFKCPWKCLKTCKLEDSPYCIALALINAKRGNLRNGFAFAGANAHRVDKIVSVKELVRTLLVEYELAADTLDLPPLENWSGDNASLVGGSNITREEGRPMKKSRCPWE